MGPLAFLIMINSLDVILKFVDDSLLIEVVNSAAASQMQSRANGILSWTAENDMKINASKTKELRISFKRKNENWIPLNMNGEQIKPVTSAKILGVTISDRLTWENHITDLVKKTSCRLYFLRMLKRAGATTPDLVTVYTSLIRPLMEYCSPVWHTSLTRSQTKLLEAIQRRALNIIDCTNISLPPLEQRREAFSRKLFNETVNGNCLNHLLDPHRRMSTSHFLRSQRPFCFRCKTARFQKSLLPYGSMNF